MWQPHTKVKTRNVGESSPFRVSFTGTLQCQVWPWATTGVIPRTRFSGIPTVQQTVQTAETSEVVVSFADAFTSVCVLAKPALLGEATATEGLTVYLLSGFFPCYSVSDKFGVQANIGEEYAHLRRSEEDLGSKVVFRMDDEWSILFGPHWFDILA